MAVLRAPRLQLQDAVQVGGGAGHRVAVVVREDLDDIPLLIRGEEVEEVGGVSPEPEGTEQTGSAEAPPPRTGRQKHDSTLEVMRENKDK